MKTVVIGSRVQGIYNDTNAAAFAVAPYLTSNDKNEIKRWFLEGIYSHIGGATFKSDNGIVVAVLEEK